MHGTASRRRRCTLPAFCAPRSNCAPHSTAGWSGAKRSVAIGPHSASLDWALSCSITILRRRSPATHPFPGHCRPILSDNNQTQHKGRPEHEITACNRPDTVGLLVLRLKYMYRYFHYVRHQTHTQSKQKAELSLGYPTVLPHSTVTSSVTWPFDSPYAISHWRSFGTKPLSI